MDFQQLLPLLLKGKLGDKEQALLKATQSSDPSAISSLLSQMYAGRQRVDLFPLLKKIMPAQTLGQIIKYFDRIKQNVRR